ncbi:hypothetical protein U9M48_033451 [Paspalum notatum var. saurae]|uniref:DUF1618 domain-containing protein n=1 Tax=Paspalum notatum var. saurae TaxID=547442 RepID=A0AAQ3UAQ4_PASNO
MAFFPCTVPPPLPTEEGGSLSPSMAILDNIAYLCPDAVFNATTAIGYMSTGARIQASFCVARPPHFSYLCVHFPGPVVGPAVGTLFGPAAGTPAVHCVRVPPLVISTHADLALIRVSVPGVRCPDKAIDYFVYTTRPRPGASSLDLLPRLDGYPRFRDEQAAILRCSSSRYVIAALRTTRNNMEFRLHLYDSVTCRWTTKLVLFLSSTPPPRSSCLDPPPSAGGILFCNVLDEHPVLRDMPLPKPARRNMSTFCRGSPCPRRDIAVVKLPEQQQLSIKYVEMGSYPRVEHSRSGSDDDGGGTICYYWTATVWSMPVPIGSWNDWHKDCKIDLANIVVDNPLLLLRLSIDPEEATVAFRRLFTSHPTLGLGMDGHVVIYFFSKVDPMDDGGWIIAVGVRDSKLQGIAELDERKHIFFSHYFCAAEISKYLINATGEAGTLA